MLLWKSDLFFRGGYPVAICEGRSLFSISVSHLTYDNKNIQYPFILKVHSSPIRLEYTVPLISACPFPFYFTLLEYSGLLLCIQS